jgi:hypothetical protein
LYTVENEVRTELRELVRQFPGGIYLHWDYWMNTQPEFAKVWRQLVLDTHATVFARRNAEAVKFAVFRLDTPYAREALGGHSKIEGPPINVDSVTAELLAGRTKPDVDDRPQDTPSVTPKGAAVPRDHPSSAPGISPESATVP